jgi:nucleoside-diphosphate-sugar epimerase
LFALFQAVGDELPPDVRPGIDAVKSMESQILDASRRGQIEGIILRYGLFYGLESGSTQQMLALVRRRLLPVVRGDRSLLACIHLDDAAAATVAALDHAPAGNVYDMVDDRAVSMTDIVLALAERAGAPRPLTVPAWLPRLVFALCARNRRQRHSRDSCHPQSRQARIYRAPARGRIDPPPHLAFLHWRWGPTACTPTRLPRWGPRPGAN